MAKIMLPNVRIAFADIFEAKAIGDGEPAFGVRAIIDPANKALVASIDAAIVQVAKEKWKDKADGILAKIKKDGNCCFLKEDYLDKNGEPYDGFEGMYSLGARSKVRPLIIDRDKTPLVASDGRPYSGCYANVQVELWAQDNNFGRRINAQLKGVQFVDDGDAFSGGTPASPNDFDDLAVGANEPALA